MSRLFKKEEPPPVEGEERLREVAKYEGEERAAEFQRTLAIARAESVSLLAREERRLAEERRREFTDLERRAGADLSLKLIEAQKRVDERLAGWASDLERVEQSFIAELGRVEQRQKQLFKDIEAKLTTDTERLTSDGQHQHSLIVKVREDLGNEVKSALEAAASELESHANERRRALHEVADRLRRRERELTEQIEREQAEAARRIEAAFSDVERRHVESLERTVRREASRLAEAAALQFEGLLNDAREDAARRLSRELDRAVSVFAREGERVLAERLAELGESGLQRIVRSRAAVTNFPQEGSST